MVQTLQLVNEYREELLYPAFCRSMEILGAEKDIFPDMRVVLKPNLIMARTPAAVATTHPCVVRVVARWLRERGVKDIVLAESSGGPYNAEYMRRIYRVCGMEELEPLLRLNTDFTAKTVDCPPGFTNGSFHLLTPIVEADYIFDLCKLKTHSMTGFSGGIKNLFGTIPGLEKPQMHYRWPQPDDFANMLLELAQTVAPQMTVIDAIDCMEGNGPTGGTPHSLHMLLAARDLYTQDWFAAGLMGLEQDSISMLRLAKERGLAKPEELVLAGDPVPEGLTPFQRPDSVRLDFADMLPGFLQKPFIFVASRLLKSYPVLRPERCVGCGKCAESCPAKIIRIRDGKAVFRRKGCISCFCCQEMCPRKAIRVKKAL